MAIKKNIIRVIGAKEHNLRNVDVDIPRDKLVVITGLSGSGKSSLAFDTIYAEGQRRYVESLSAYARQFLNLMSKPDVERIEGLSPAISIEQKTTSKNPRSTVGTVTEIYDYMRLLWARIGVPYSPATGKPITSQTISHMVDILMALPEGTRLYLLAPIVRGRKGEYKKDIAELMKQGFLRLKVDGEFYAIEDFPDLDKKYKHSIDVVVDRVVIRPELESRLADSLETALKLADGLAMAEFADAATNDKDAAEPILFSEKFACPISGFTIPEIEPRLFSFNNPYGACPTCDGLGMTSKFDPDLVVPNSDLSLEKGAIKPWSSGSSRMYRQTLQALAQHFGVSMTEAWHDLPASFQDKILYGTGDEVLAFVYSEGKRKFETEKTFEGVLPNLQRRWRDTDSNWVREELGKYQSAAPCTACDGKRLKPQSLAVKLGKKDISDVTGFSISEAGNWFKTLETSLNKQQKAIGSRVMKEIRDRLSFLNDVGLEYLSLSRASGTLSGGESQRIRLASQIGSGLTGVLYVLDEPSIGLHQRDNERLLETLQNLRDLGNSVLVVEHDEEAILAADHVIDMGPLAGIHGGEVIAQGTATQIAKNPKSLTGQYLSGKKQVPLPAKRREMNPRRILRIEGASGNNLKNITAEFPLGLFVCITGVSGGGKSTLVTETLYKGVMRKLHGSTKAPMPHDYLDGVEHLDKVIEIDQSPIGRTPRSNPATYTGAFTPIRDWFAGLPESKTRGYMPGRFSFNVKGGRCEACRGDGVLKIEMHFLPDVYVECDTCHGQRYNRETLQIKFKGKSIADVLDMTVDEAADFFKAVPSVRDKMLTLQRVGLGYVHVGQRATTLSGGEAQRVKLSRELSKRATGRTLYILDEPTTGLHFEDVRKLLEVLQELVGTGNTVIVIEHNLDVIKQADWILDLGPEGGDGGGELVADGTPEDVAKAKNSWTGKYLKTLLQRQQ
ncbi:Excinuclease ABC subunit A [hydrothermal vent metagenome]|uniref:Excinuclease ABC subunit A n=1 Tax=hydrothermal vent metagenome TaxID=652676 RepID=A0A3B0SFJ2_9ZZZZ